MTGDWRPVSFCESRDAWSRELIRSIVYGITLTVVIILTFSIVISLLNSYFTKPCRMSLSTADIHLTLPKGFKHYIVIPEKGLDQKFPKLMMS